MQSANQSTETRQLRSQRLRLWRTFVRNKTAIVGLILAIISIILAVFADDWFIAVLQGREANLLIAPYDPSKQDTINRLQPPDRVHHMGLDDYGRDIFSRVIYGGRVSLTVGLCATLLGGAIGTAMGVVAGYMGGTVENVIMRAVDALMAFPGLLMGMMVLAVLHRLPGSGLTKAIFCIGIIMASGFARVAHATTISIKERDFVMAARAVGAGNFRILRLHILPNIVGELVVMASLQTAQAIRVEASLSFIGLGVSPPTPTWGNMIKDGMQHITYAPWFSLYPGLAILLTILAFNLLGDGLRDILDPRLQE
ncbi:MAG: ABC transporter permease [Anaerolineae bacterium]|nr:ABC transporter permease [Anaerolineae bacterium]